MTRHVVAAVTASLAILFLLVRAPANEVLASPTDVLSVKRVDATCTGYCVVCQWGAPEHAADDAPGSNYDALEGDGWHMSCRYPGNCTGHNCGASFGDDEEQPNISELFDQVGQAVLHGNEDQLRVILDRHGKSVHFDVERQAIQIQACDGDIIAHYPVDPAVAVGLLQ